MAKRRTSLVIMGDAGTPITALLPRLSCAEQELVGSISTECQRRQSLLARLVAHSAIRNVLPASLRDSTIEILKGSNDGPLALVNGQAGVIGISLSHSSRLVAAVAWQVEESESYSAGVDVERLRNSDIGDSAYAFSRRERRLIRAAAQVTAWSGIAAWVAKEAAWKALCPEPESGLDTVEIQALDLRSGDVTLKPLATGRKLCQAEIIRAHLSIRKGPDGLYILGLAENGGNTFSFCDAVCATSNAQYIRRTFDLSERRINYET